MSNTAPSSGTTLSPLESLAGKHVLLIGTTGFVAKVALSMLLERFSLGRVYCLVRSQRSKSAQERFYTEVMASEMMEPLRQRLGPSFDAYVRDKVEVVPGDISMENLGLTDEVADRLRRELDLVVNSAGLVTFNPPLDDAVKINAVGAKECAEFTHSCDHAALLHVSTCFVAGNKSGRIREDTPIVGYFPRSEELSGTEFDWSRELRDVTRDIEDLKSRTNDAALEARFRKEAFDRLKEDGREPQPRTVRAAITNQRRRWVAEELIRIGLDRAQHWGWPNIYTYSKALGEQAIASTEGLRWAIVRPAIVESANEYPFPGWNEGMNTSAPLAYLGLHGHVVFPAGDDLILDVVPVDHVASTMIAAMAALAEGENGKAYQVAAGDTNPCTMARTVELVGLYKRRKIKKDEASGDITWWQARLKERVNPLPRSRAQYEQSSAPAFSKLVKRARRFLDDKDPARYGPFGGLVTQARTVAKQAETDLDRVINAFDLFMPFVFENRYVFRTVQTRSLFERMNEADRALLPYTTPKIDWRTYWLEVHVPGLEKWVFPKLETSGPKRVAIPRSHRDLSEMFQSRTEEHARRIAFRMLRKDDVADSFTYRDVRRAAEAVALHLGDHGVGNGDRVLVVSESRPEWGMSYFGVILAGATAVPVDVDLKPSEIANIARASKAKAIIASDTHRHRLADTELAAPVWGFDSVFANAHRNQAFAAPKRKPEDIASIIFTSGTTGTPKGVMLTDRNFAALTSRVLALFDLNRTDALLSVLPLHHTFEFSAGFLMPINAGASITYLEERTPELLQRAFAETPVTGMIGVPAVWESLHRKIFGELAAKGRFVERVVRSLMMLNRRLRDNSPWNLGRWVFRPMHGALGGRVRMMVSGGAPLKQSLWKDFRGLGFSLYEGYGLTEASPVISVAWPRTKTPAGSVGWPLPGIEVRIDSPSGEGVGEVLARGPTIMAGYLDNRDATIATVRDGWLHTGDQGRLDDDGRLFIVGRQKDVIIDTGGKNVYPDEIEALYAKSPFIKELCVVGIPADQGTGERVAALVVPDYDATEVDRDGLSREQVRDEVRAHFRDIGSKEPIARRVKVLHFWDEPLPKTSTRKIKRPYVRDTLERLEATRRSVRASGDGGGRDGAGAWVRRTVALIAQRSADQVRDGQRLIDDLGFDSLMQLELLNAIEDALPNAGVSSEEMTSAETVRDVIRLAQRSKDVERAAEVGDSEEEAPLKVPKPVAKAGKAMLGWAQMLAYERLFEVTIEGRGNVPANANFIIAANHTSHLDMGLVKYAIRDLAGDVVTLAAKDYFFDDPLRRVYFENFTNLLPMDRHGSLKKSLRLASESLRQGDCLLVFPEGTRSRTGEMAPFKPAIGYLSLNERVDILPVFLDGAHDALPVGAAMPRQRELRVRVGEAISAHKMLGETKGMARAGAYRHVTDKVERVIRRLAGLPMPDSRRDDPRLVVRPTQGGEKVES